MIAAITHLNLCPYHTSDDCNYRNYLQTKAAWHRDRRLKSQLCKEDMQVIQSLVGLII